MRPAVRKTEPHKAKTGGNLVVVVFFAARTMASALWVGPLHPDREPCPSMLLMSVFLFETSRRSPSCFFFFAAHFWNFKNLEPAILYNGQLSTEITQKCIKW